MDLFFDNRKTKLFLKKKKINEKDRVYVDRYNILDYVNLDESVKIFGLGQDVLDCIKELHTEGLIHLGLRTKNINNHLLLSLPKISFGSVELYTVIDTEDYNNKWKEFKGESVKTSPINLPDISICYLDDYKEELLTQFDGEFEIAMDFETWGLTYQKDFFPLGVSLSSKDKAVYFAFPDRYENIKDHPIFEDFRLFIERNSKRIWTYNCPFEMGVLNRMYNKTYELQDAFVLVMCDGRRGSLKLNGQYYLGIKSWDDEIDKIQKYFNNVFTRYSDGKVFLSRFKDSKFFTNQYITDPRIESLTGGKLNTKIKKEDLELFNKDMPGEFNSFKNADSPYEFWEDRVVRYWGNTWAVVPDSLMGYYCCMDSFVTLKIVEKLKPIFTKECYDVHIHNMYLKYCSDTGGQIRIDWNLKNSVEEYYKRVEFNSKAFLTLMTYSYHRLYFDEIVGESKIKEYNIHPGILNDLYYYKSYFYFESIPTMRAKKFVKLIKTKEGIDENILSNIVGSENVYLFTWLSTEKINIKNLQKVDELLENIIHSQKTIHSIIDDYYNMNKNMILNRNKEILKNYWKKDVKELEKFILDGIFSNQKTDSKILDNLKLYYMDDPKVKYRLKNNFLPIDYVKNVLMFPILNKKIKALSKILKEKTIESSIDDSINKFFDYNFKSSKVNLELGSWMEYFFKDKVFYALMFYDTYLDMCEEGFEPKLSTFSDFTQMIDFYKKSENKLVLKHDRSYEKFYGHKKVSWRFTNFYKQITEKRFLNFCKCFEEMDPFVLKRDDKLIEPKANHTSLFFLDFYDKIIRLYKYATKELSSAIRFINNNSYKTTTISNAVVVGEKGNGDEYFSIPKIIPLSTKTGRFAASIHTIGGGDDGKLLMINDGPDMIASYFDVSQAEVRMLATLSKDKKLLEIFELNKDPYKEMAIEAYPYLAKKENAKQLKDIRQDYKGTFLSYLYQARPITIAGNTGLPVKRVNEIVQNLDDNYQETVQWARDMVWYAESKKLRKTLFGNKSFIEENENLVTTAVNHPVQEATTKILGDGFYNIIKTATDRNILNRFKYSTHDSCVIMFPIKNIFEMVMIYRVYFRKYIKDTFNVDFKYDLDLFLHNHRDHSLFKYNHKDGLFYINGYNDLVIRFLMKLKDFYDFYIVKEICKNVKVDDMILKNTSTQPGRDHDIFPINNIISNRQKLEITCKLEQPLILDFIEESLFDDNIEIN